MKASLASLRAQHRLIAPALEPLRRFATWWMSAARSVVPAAWADAFVGHSSAMVLLEREDESVRAHVVDGERGGSVFIPDPMRCLAALDDWLIARGRDRRQLRVVVAMDRSDVLARSFTIPEAAVPALQGLLEQEVLRRTPFALDEIWQAARLKRLPAGLRSVDQWIVRRDRAHAAMAALGLREQDVDALSVGAGGDPFDKVLVPIRGADRLPSSGANRTVLACLAVAGCVTLVGLIAWDRRDAATLDAVSADVDRARLALRTERGETSGDLSVLLLGRSKPRLTRIWAEVSRLMPDDTFLTELRLTDDTITLSGFSSNAARLVHVVDASSLFTRAALVGPIEPNATEGKDRFSLSFDLRSKTRRTIARVMPSSSFGSISP